MADKKEIPVENLADVKHVKASEILAIPEKFKDEKGTLKAQDLLKSYLSLEKKLTETASAKTAEKALRVGMPESSDKYDIKLKSDAIALDADVNKRLFDMGFTNEQVQAVYDLAVEKILPVIQNMAADYKADQEMAALEKEFGGPERFNQIARQIFMWGEKNLAPDVFQTLACSRDGIVTLHKMMNASEPEVIKERPEQDETVSEESLRRMMQDPQYWKKSDPVFVKQIEAGFKKLYG